jgi:hypothetical protein
MPLYRNRAVALLAMLAMTLQALWPLIAQAKPHIPGEQVPVCTVEGITHYVELPAPDSPVEKSSAAHHEHCKMCVFGAAKLALRPFAAPIVKSGQDSQRPPESLQAVSSPSSFHLPALPRAPPAAS